MLLVPTLLAVSHVHVTLDIQEMDSHAQVITVHKGLINIVFTNPRTMQGLS